MTSDATKALLIGIAACVVGTAAIIGVMEPSSYIFACLWIGVILLGVLGCALLEYMSGRRSRFRVGRCRRCGYDLRHLGDRRSCPECGQKFVVNQRGDVLS